MAPLALSVASDRILRCGDLAFRCALGRAGITRAKREGDGATPAGAWPLRRLLYRPDRMGAPQTGLPAAPLAPADGWCDDPAHADYNRQVHLPHPASCEHMWRADSLYDLLVVLGFNDAPVVPGAGSAIFLHIAAQDYSPTQGCVALAPDDLLGLLPLLDSSAILAVKDV